MPRVTDQAEMKPDTAYMEVPFCTSCRWWERRTADATTFGWCRYLSDIKIDIGVALIRGEWDDATVGEKVFTAEDFGCVQWEARPVAEHPNTRMQPYRATCTRCGERAPSDVTDEETTWMLAHRCQEAAL
jgi:hypothetical protein